MIDNLLRNQRGKEFSIQPGFGAFSVVFRQVAELSDLFEAFESGKVASFVTDFPDEELLKHDKVIGIPHLGARLHRVQLRSRPRPALTSVVQ